MQLVEGVELEGIWWPGDESSLEIDDPEVERIVVTMENGQTGKVPWARVDYADGTTCLLNLAHVAGVELRGES